MASFRPAAVSTTYVAGIPKSPQNHSPSTHPLFTVISDWLSNLSRNSHTRRYLVGIDVEWLLNRLPSMDNPVAVLQLCVDRECLVFQILHAPYVPDSLVAFLENQNNTFVGVGVGEDVEKLLRDYTLHVANFVKLCTLAAERLGDHMKRVGLKTLALHVLGRGMEKPRKITMSKWNDLNLSPQQVRYACLDAFVSFEIGRVLNAGN
ncbi:3'-5' exonuclease-like [Vicia villosa]|uniref:3'-5' exonuclease-like n=1 Tax=Vicia villosa TaxID=3911 RepID=UPI00273AEEC2|nr:3'-5' exonuclease-like [Vicia villosa]